VADLPDVLFPLARHFPQKGTLAKKEKMYVYQPKIARRILSIGKHNFVEHWLKWHFSLYSLSAFFRLSN
jgi:hypothetical protein